MRPDQMVEEFKGCLALAKHCLTTLGLEEDVTYHLSKWDPDNREKYIGEPEVWNQTEESIRQVLTELNIPFTRRCRGGCVLWTESRYQCQECIWKRRYHDYHSVGRTVGRTV